MTQASGSFRFMYNVLVFPFKLSPFNFRFGGRHKAGSAAIEGRGAAHGRPGVTSYNRFFSVIESSWDWVVQSIFFSPNFHDWLHAQSL